MSLCSGLPVSKIWGSSQSSGYFIWISYVEFCSLRIFGLYFYFHHGARSQVSYQRSFGRSRYVYHEQVNRVSLLAVPKHYSMQPRGFSDEELYNKTELVLLIFYFVNVVSLAYTGLLACCDILSSCPFVFYFP